MRAREMDEGLPQGFEPSFDECYEDPMEMHWEYEEEWDKNKVRL